MKNAKVRPEFLNLYDGLNIKYEAEILEVKEDSVVFRVDMMQNFSHEARWQGLYPAK